MANNGLQIYNGFSSLSTVVDTGVSYVRSIYNKICNLIYGGKFIEAQKEIEIAKIQAKREERSDLIKLMYKLADETTDDRMRKEMFQEIRLMLIEG